jgi:hypothetical protein
MLYQKKQIYNLLVLKILMIFKTSKSKAFAVPEKHSFSEIFIYQETKACCEDGKKGFIDNICIIN